MIPVFNQYDPEPNELKKLFGVLVGFLLALIVCALLGSCKTVKYVPVYVSDTIVNYQKDTIVERRISYDSIWVHDSIFESIFLKGDTIVQYKYIEKLAYKDRVKHDSIYINKVDTVQQVHHDTQIVEVEVEKKLGWIDRQLLKFGRLAFLLISVLVLLGCAYLVYTKKRK